MSSERPTILVRITFNRHYAHMPSIVAQVLMRLAGKYVWSAEVVSRPSAAAETPPCDAARRSTP